jgi:hypothetical protein
MRDNQVDEKVLEKVDPKKRAFIKKVLVGAAFATPLMQSVSMDGINSAKAAPVSD